MSKREDNRRKRRANIISTAHRLFLEKGIAQVQMLEIAEQAGISTATLFRYFPGKAEVVLAVTDQLMLNVIDATEAIVKSPLTAYEKIEKILNYFIVKKDIERTKFLRYLEAFEALSAVEDFPFQEKYAETHLRYAELLYEVIEQGKIDGSIRSDIDAEAYIFVSVYSFSLLNMKMAQKDQIPILPPLIKKEEQKLALKDMLLSSLKA